MKKCHKCGSELADDARFCLECGTECRTMEVKRKPKSGPETGEAGPLVGDKNLINESTIIGKQEKYEASNITIHNTINEDQSHKIVECAVSGKRIYMDQSVVCPQCGGQVALEYYVETSKRCENCEQQAREEYRVFVARVMGAPGPFDAASSHRCRNAGFDSAGLAAARSVRKCGGAEFRAAGRTGGRGEASDYGDRA